MLALNAVGGAVVINRKDRILEFQRKSLGNLFDHRITVGTRVEGMKVNAEAESGKVRGRGTWTGKSSRRRLHLTSGMTGSMTFSK